MQKLITETLSKKEKDTLNLLSEGLLYKEIAAAQGVAIDTVKKHLKNTYRKLDVRNRTEALLKFRKISDL